MPCLSSVELTELVIIGGTPVVIAAAGISHGILRPLLEARGVSPWTVKDTLGSTPLVLIGSSLIGACVSVVAVMVGRSCDDRQVWVAGAGALAVIGAGLIKLGLLALKKVV